LASSTPAPATTTIIKKMKGGKNETVKTIEGKNQRRTPSRKME